MKIDDVININIIKLGINGEGIGYFNKRVFFVYNALPGENVNVKIINIKNNLYFCEVVSFNNRNTNRISSFCKYYDLCGGCQIQHIDYEEGLKLKRDILIEAIDKYSGLNYRSFEIRDMIKMDNPYNYRNKSSLPISKKKISVCMYQKNSNKLISIDTCPIQDNIINEVNNNLVKVINKYKLEDYIRFIVARVVYNNDTQVSFILNKEKDLKYISEDILSIKNVKSFYSSVNKKDGVIFGDKLNYLGGMKVLTEKLGNLKYNLLPNSFFQLNKVQTVKLYDEVKKACRLSGKEIILDAYCGVGSISFWISDKALKVIGIDNNKEAIMNANENMKLNNIKNTEFYYGDVSTVIKNKLNEVKFDVLITDPPRTGLGDFVYDIINLRVKTFVYVSCNPSTLGKDLKILSKYYKVKYITPLDMFPFTSHIESIVVLSLK